MTHMTNYIVMIPARDEAQFIQQTLQSIVAQTVRPSACVVINDGSHDQTGPLAEAVAAHHPWIQVLNRPDRGVRNSAGGEVEAFYDGLKLVRAADWEFIVKLDGDVSFEPDYFERCFARFAADPKLGVGGGAIYHIIDGQPVVEGEHEPLFHVRGATKIYRRACWEAIGPLLTAPGWDTLDEVKANMLGWTTLRFNDIRMCHHRFTGAAVGPWKNAIKNGLANYVTGYHPLFMALKCVKRLAQKPYLVEAAGLGWGFLSGYLRQVPQVPDRALIRYLRDQQMRRLTFRESLWG